MGSGITKCRGQNDRFSFVSAFVFPYHIRNLALITFFTNLGWITKTFTPELIMGNKQNLQISSYLIFIWRFNK